MRYADSELTVIVYSKSAPFSKSALPQRIIYNLVQPAISMAAFFEDVLMK